MPHRYDAAVKTLIEQYPLDWFRSLGVPVEGSVSQLEADFSTVSAAVDKLLRVEKPTPMLIDLELQTSRDADLPYRLLLYAALALYRHRMPFLGLVVLLRKEADFPELTGQLTSTAGEEGGVEFRYRVVRVWEQDPEWALESGLGTLPLAPLTQISEGELRGVLREMGARLKETEPAARATLWTTAYIPMGLRYPREICRWALEETRSMKDSVTYQAILEEGREEGALLALLRIGKPRLGIPSPSVQAKLESLPYDRLVSLLDRLLLAESWEEFLSE